LGYLKNAFLAHFHPLAFKESLQEQLWTIKMGIGESVDFNNCRMEYLLEWWNNHQMPNDYLIGIFKGGLYFLNLG